MTTPKKDLIPYNCMIIDCSYCDFVKSAAHCVPRCLMSSSKHSEVISNLQQIWTTKEDPRRVFPSLSVRTTLDLFLQAQNFPPGSEIIMSAINIPDMVQVVHHHGLRIVSLDVAVDTLGPKEELIDGLVTGNTVAILLAHLYGKWFDIRPFVEAARRHNIVLIEDCAEAFCGFHRLGSPAADITLFSFGVIKHFTAFGGAMSKIKDGSVYKKMCDLHKQYPVQTQSSYLYKLLKYSMLYPLINWPAITKSAQRLSRFFNVDTKKHVVASLRGFPHNLIARIRHQPSLALLQTMLRRFQEFDPTEVDRITRNGHYVSERLPDFVMQVGNKAKVNHYWLFPIVVNDPQQVLKSLNDFGVEAYRGATQLSLVKPDIGYCQVKHLQSLLQRYPVEARYVMEHVIYLPVTKIVPSEQLDKMCKVLEHVLNIDDKRATPSAPHPCSKLIVPSKL